MLLTACMNVGFCTVCVYCVTVSNISDMLENELVQL